MKTLINTNNQGTNKAFDNLINEVFNDQHSKQFNPLVNVYQNSDKYHVDIALPGFTKELVEITLENNTLLISGENKPAVEDVKNTSFTKRQIPVGRFEKTYKLPEKVDQEGIAAVFENGILSISIPKAAKETYSKTIEIL